MRALISFFILFTIYNTAYSQKAPVEKISPQIFFDRLITDSVAILIDVRTRTEYANGHIANSRNIDLKSTDFSKHVSKLDKSSPIYLYCLSGGRSSEAVGILSELGFKSIFELDGGMMAWRNNSLPEVRDTVISKSISRKSFNKMLKSEKLLLINYYAEWCGPCKQMKPDLLSLEQEMDSQIELIRIDVDANKDLIKGLNIQGLPVLQIYKDENLVWNKAGYVAKENIVHALNNHL